MAEQIKKRNSLTNEDGEEILHLEDLQRVRSLRLIDDDFMIAVFDDNIEATELLLRIVMNMPDLRVINVKTQRIMKNLLGRDVWLDIDAEDSSGRMYDIEIQRSDKGAGFRRARYHSSIKDAHLLKSGEDFDTLPESYVIFITENDVIGDGEPLYKIERQITNTGEPFDDGEHIIYVNGSNRDASTELGRLMHDFFCTNADDMHYRILSDRVRYYKEDEEGVETMCKVMEDMRAEAIEMDRVNNAKNLIREGELPTEQIAKYSMLPVDRVIELEAEVRRE